MGHEHRVEQPEPQRDGVMTDDLMEAFEVVFTLATCQLARSCCQARTEGEAALNRVSRLLAEEGSNDPRRI